METLAASAIMASLCCAAPPASSSPAAAAAPSAPIPLTVTEQVLFKSGEGGYAVYRIPSLVKTKSGKLLVFAEARRTGKADHGEIDVVMRGSADAGKTWGPMQLVWDAGVDTAGNPTPVVDQKTGKIILISCWNRGSDAESAIMAGTSAAGRRVFELTSSDEGVTWSAAREITSSVMKGDWRWYATGPCHAIQMASGRIVIPANHSDLAPEADHYRSHVFFSDDGGETWALGGDAGARTNESTVVEIPGGPLVLNMRSYENANQRAITTSTDGGVTWSDTKLDPQLDEPRCQASLLAVTSEGKQYFLFSNPASTKRDHMTVKWSSDAMMTWNAGLAVYAGPSAYSDMVMADEGTLALAFERDAYAQISLILAPLAGIVAVPQTLAQGVGAVPNPPPRKKEK
ncbi:MAG: sialidase family protein [Candidatus Sumerlaeota bacterium]